MEKHLKNIIDIKNIKKDKISRLIFKCIYHRKDEKIRIELKNHITWSEY